MKIVYFGHTKRGIKCLKAIKKSKHDILLTVALKSENEWYTSVYEIAKTLQLPAEICNNPNENSFIEKIRALNADLGIIVGYSKYIGKNLRESFKLGIINLHASYLPEYRGAAPLNWALINGENKIGLSIYFIDAGIDTGPIIKQEFINIDINHTINDVITRSLELYPKMLIEVCDKIDKGDYSATVQNLHEGSYFTKRKPEDGLIDWRNHTDFEIHNLIRALTKPYPGAFFIYLNQKVYIWKAGLEDKNYYGIPGRVATRKGGGVVVIAKNRGIRLITVQLEGEPVCSAEELFTKVGEDFY